MIIGNATRNGKQAVRDNRGRIRNPPRDLLGSGGGF
jgi:hypothetical protein